MKTMLVCVVLLIGAWVLSAADVSGKWSGTIDVKEDGEQRAVPALLILKQDGNKITGTAGEDENDRHPVQKGVADGDNITIEVNGGEAIFYLDLKLDGDQMSGDARKGDSPKMKISLKRVKE